MPQRNWRTSKDSNLDCTYLAGRLGLEPRLNRFGICGAAITLTTLFYKTGYIFLYTKKFKVAVSILKLVAEAGFAPAISSL